MLAQDTIAAIATAPGLAALSVVRVSGPEACRIASSCFSGPNLEAVDSHTAHVGVWVSPEDVRIDRVVATVFRKPRTATGEDLVEVTCHGGDYVAALILDNMIHRGARLAQPGEFTQWAFLSGKIDLAQAEAVADLIHASSEKAHRISLAAYEGHYSEELEKLRTAILELCALAELEIDFTDEDVEFADRTTIKNLIEHALQQIRDLRNTTRLGTVVREGIRVVIAGRPNAGKSTLLNSLSGRDRAIVSAQPGTTRDILEVDSEFGGLRFRFMDTAGLRQSEDAIEQEGVQRAHSMIKKGDIVLYVYDLVSGWTDEDQAALNLIEEIPVILVGNKADLVQKEAGEGLQLSAIDGPKAVEPLISELLEQASKTYGNADASRVVMNARHNTHLKNAYQALQNAQQILNTNHSPDFFSMDLRAAARELGMITGAITNETILGAIFSRFCIGK
ncbi:MAG: tRNA uridine-5-carboxymethylaminomethyl(34) synthesis GTPase MnmE [Bacteroidetes bacterium]|nr:tRNA uridine-5-carboxymethylaminomethyl(34) synthesis GTPase MnmE [Bacteroidota bacterium]MCY4206273.1 tRNA uridine-5-carboxymethylaminomethyl(34) synthesis GTPase MnmE [Bacteroidota bacterium]